MYVFNIRAGCPDIFMSMVSSQNEQKGHSSRTFEVSVPTHVALRMLIMQDLASQLHFLANKNAGLAILPLLWPVNCIKIGGHVALLSGPIVHSPYCGIVEDHKIKN